MSSLQQRPFVPLPTPTLDSAKCPASIASSKPKSHPNEKQHGLRSWLIIFAALCRKNVLMIWAGKARLVMTVILVPIMCSFLCSILSSVINEIDSDKFSSDYDNRVISSYPPMNL